MISPTIGRKVWYRPSAYDMGVGCMSVSVASGQACDATIVYVHSDTCVNLVVFDHNGQMHVRTSVILSQGDNPVAPGAAYAEWMPYQVNQAKKQEVVAAESSTSDQSIEQEIQAKGLTAPRVTPDDIAANIVGEYYFNGSEGVYGAEQNPYEKRAKSGHILGDYPLFGLTFCVLVLRNGFTVTGESACASPSNFDAELGRKIARENAINKVWPLMGYALKQSLYDHGFPSAIQPESLG